MWRATRQATSLRRRLPETALARARLLPPRPGMTPAPRAAVKPPASRDAVAARASAWSMWRATRQATSLRRRLPETALARARLPPPARYDASSASSCEASGIKRRGSRARKRVVDVAGDPTGHLLAEAATGNGPGASPPTPPRPDTTPAPRAAVKPPASRDAVAARASAWSMWRATRQAHLLAEAATGNGPGASPPTPPRPGMTTAPRAAPRNAPGAARSWCGRLRGRRRVRRPPSLSPARPQGSGRGTGANP